MKNLFTFLAILFLSSDLFAQYDYDPSQNNEFGKANPNAPQQIKDFEPMIGLAKCKSTTRKSDGNWNDPIDMLWKFKYIMNGMAVQDETLKADGKHSGSIRQFIADSSKWYVHYYSSASPSTTLPVWEGARTDNSVVLYRDQKAPNGSEGDFRLTFYDFEPNGYKWIGEWVSKDKTIVYPTWKIECTREE